jgi:hypothetical protein
LSSTTTNLQYTRKKYSNTYRVDFFTDNTFLLSTLGVGAAPRVLADLFSPVVGGVCSGGEIVMVTIELKSAAGGDCTVAAPAEPDDGSTVMEGTLRSLTILSPTASSTLCFECLGFEELP